MKAYRNWLGMVGALVLAACSADVDQGQDVSIGETQQNIVRARKDGGRNQVVLVYAMVFDGTTGETSPRSCSGAYYSSRVVVTAAHCLDADPAKSESITQVLVYYGDDFAADFSQLTSLGTTYGVPAPGQPTSWAAADSFETHPDWNRELIHPDLGVVYLDRKLPFDPLPLARFHLGRDWEGQKVEISGWGANEATGPTTGTGGREQRTGRTRLLGSPTAADYHPEDPNPGMLVPSIRRNVIKTDGGERFSNACFGDSGGPVIVKHHGNEYIGGTEYFGGLFCEDYSLYTRVDAYLPFLDAAAHKAGHAPLVPQLECVAPNADGTFTAFFGYDNDNGVSVRVPYGSKNFLPQDAAKNRPEVFAPGEHSFAFGADFTAGQTLLYKLAPPSGPTTLLSVNQSSPTCGTEQAAQALCGSSCRAQLRSGCTELQSYAACIEGCVGFNQLFADVPECLPQLDDWNRCIADTPPSPASWQCYPESSPGAGDGIADAPDCTPLIDGFFGCLFGG